MVDVATKAAVRREAVAAGMVRMGDATRALALSGGGKKGDVRAAAEIAGVMAAKKTAELIPLCHQLNLSSVEVAVEPGPGGLSVIARAAAIGPTGVEMEAMTAVAVACLTLYDMLKAAERGMVIEGIRLVEKSGGASGDWRAT
jgi:cyclic pyranopterin phosphate synthase